MSFMLCLWLAFNAEVEKKQVIAQIEESGGQVHFQYQENPKAPGTFLKTVPTTPAWLRRLAGKNVLQEPVTLFDSGSKVNLSNLRCMPLLNTVAVYDRNLLDAEMAAIASLPRLRNLDLDCVPIIDKQLSSLQNTANLWFLQIARNQKLNGTGLDALLRLKKLTWLMLPGCGITDEGVKSIGKLEQLEYLSLSGTSVTDRGLEHLGHLKELSGLDLTDTKVTDRGISHLSTLKKLDVLDVTGSRVTRSGVEELMRALPQCNIEYREAD